MSRLEEDEVREKFVVRLTEEEHNQLKEIVTKGKTAAYRIKHANILLKADADGPAWQDEAIAQAFSVHLSTVGCIRKRFVEQGLEAAMNQYNRADENYLGEAGD